MKKTITTVITGLVLTLGLTFTSCKKAEKGDTGPAGTNGTNGNANVIGTNVVTVSTWAASGSVWESTITFSGITSNVVDKGIVSVFVLYGTSWWALPDLNGKNSTQYGFGIGFVKLLNSNSDGTTPANPGTQTFRIVVVSPSNRIANPNVNWNNYAEVKKVLNLKD